MASKKKNPTVELAKKDAKIAVAVAKKKAKEALAAAKIKFAAAHKSIDKKIETHPDEAVLIAATLGAAVGALAGYAVAKKKKK